MIWVLTTTAWALPPFDGCSFWREDLLRLGAWPAASKYTGCADYQVYTNACIKTKVVGFEVITYQGDLVMGRSPEYLIEVTPHFGKSIFAHPIDGEPLQAQLNMATEFWDSTLEAGWLPKPGKGGSSSDIHSDPEQPSNFYHGRVIQTPAMYGAWAWPDLGVTTGKMGMPTCFTAISEFTPNTWVDREGNPEKWLAGLYGPFGVPFCDQRGPLTAIEAFAPMPGLAEATPNEAICATPAPNARVYAGLLNPGSDAANPFLNPSTMCAGRLGLLFPRTGWSNLTQEPDNAQLIAMRIASIGKDHFQSQPGLEPDDRFQLVWPLAGDMQCFIPGELSLSELLPMKYFPVGEGTDSPDQSPEYGVEGSGTFVYALWRRWSECVEPGQGSIWELEMNVMYEARKAACAAAPKGTL